MQEGLSTPVTAKTAMTESAYEVPRLTPDPLSGTGRTEPQAPLPGSTHVDAVVLCQRPEPALEALTDGTKPLLSTSATQLAKDHRPLRRTVFRQIVAGQLVVVAKIDHANESIAHLAKPLPTSFVMVGGPGNGNFSHKSRFSRHCRPQVPQPQS